MNGAYRCSRQEAFLNVPIESGGEMMKCRICREEIIFIKGNRLCHEGRSTFAVHRSRLEDTLEQTQGEIVTPSLSYQRKLRADLEELHPPVENIDLAIVRMDTDLDNSNLAPPVECEDTSALSVLAASLTIDPFVARTAF
jgi:hypothetical protein